MQFAWFCPPKLLREASLGDPLFIPNAIGVSRNASADYHFFDAKKTPNLILRIYIYIWFGASEPHSAYIYIWFAIEKLNFLKSF